MNANVLVNTRDMAREDWLKARMNGIGGSDTAAIAGINKWKAPAAVYLEKIGAVEPQVPGEAAYWGTILENVVAKEFMMRTGFRVQRRNAILQHPEYPFMLANVDRLIIGQKAGLECKTASEYRKEEWEDGRIPDEYMLQVQHYMSVTGYDSWFIAVLIGGNKFIFKEVARDDEMIQYLIQIESDFWKLVESKTPPEMDGSESSGEVLKFLYPESKGTEILLPDESESILIERDTIKADIKTLELKQEEIENKIKALLGENESGRVGNKVVTWKSISSNRVDTKKLKAEQPAVYEKYVKETSYRKFDVKEIKGGK